MFSPGAQNVALFVHARTIAGRSGDGGRALPTRQAGGLGVVELPQKLRVSFTALAVGSTPDRQISAHAAIRVDAAA